jgi:hypothetical protein
VKFKYDGFSSRNHAITQINNHYPIIPVIKLVLGFKERAIITFGHVMKEGTSPFEFAHLICNHGNSIQ